MAGGSSASAGGGGQASSFRLYLQSELARRCAANPQYSLRSFALNLGTDHSTLSQLLRGRRALTAQAIDKLGRRLGLSPAEIAAFVTHEELLRSGDTSLSRDVRRLTVDAAQLLTDYNHKLILELTAAEGFRADSRWIARALNLGVDEVNVLLARLLRLGMLTMEGPGRWADCSGAAGSSEIEFARRVILGLSERVRAVAGAAPSSAGGGDESRSEQIEFGRPRLPDALDLIGRVGRELSAGPRPPAGADRFRLELKLYPPGGGNTERE